MINYSVDTDPRPRVHLLLGAASLAGAYLLALIPALAHYRFAAPSVFFIFGSLLWLFNNYLWRWPGLQILAGIPDISGVWKGTLTMPSFTSDPEPKVVQEVTLRVS